MIKGLCTAEGSLRFRNRFPNLPDSHFSNASGLRISSIGLGTYLGEETEAVDRMTIAAGIQLITNGCNVIDTAPNYRNGMSEVAVGQALERVIRETGIGRDELFIMTKAGILSENIVSAIESASLEMSFCNKIFQRFYCFDPEYIHWQIDRSRKALGIDTIDCIFLHNMEMLLLDDETRRHFEDVFERAVQTLEDLCSQGLIGMYGIATWNAFRVEKDDPAHISLYRLLDLVRSIQGERHHFRAIQLPFGLWGPEALTVMEQDPGNDQGKESILLAASQMGVSVFTNSSLLQGELLMLDLNSVPFVDGLSPAQKAIQFNRCVPGNTTVLVGMKHIEHCDGAIGLFPKGKEFDILSLFD